MTGGEKTSWGGRLLVIGAIAVLIGGTAYDFRAFSTQPTGVNTEAPLTATSSTSNSSTAEYVTGTKVTESDTLFTASCLPSTGGGGFQFRVVSDSTGQPVSGETVNAANRDSCSNQTASETQVVYVGTFVVGRDGWMTPDNLNYIGTAPSDFTVVYEGATYTFSARAPPIYTDCVTLHVPSGNVTTATVPSSHCWGNSSP